MKRSPPPPDPGAADRPRRGTRITLEEAERLLRGDSGGLPVILLAAGADDYLRGRLVDAFRAGADAEGAELQRLEGDDLDASALAGALAAMSLFALSRRVWIREGAKLEKGADDALIAWARGAAEGTRVLVTSARDVGELKLLQAIAAAGVTVACEPPRPEAATPWIDRMLTEAGLKLPAGAAGALAARAGGLLEARQEIEKLRAAADSQGRVPPDALAGLRGARTGASLDRWADAVLARDPVESRRQAAALEAEGVGGTSALWAVAERALAALEPQAFAYRRGPASRVRLTPATARAALHAVYTADRALKRGEVKDAELRDLIERTIFDASGSRANDAARERRGEETR